MRLTLADIGSWLFINGILIVLAVVLGLAVTMLIHGTERTEEFRETFGVVSVHLFILLQFGIIGLFFYCRQRWNFTSKDFMKGAFACSSSFGECALTAFILGPFVLFLVDSQSIFEMCFWGIILFFGGLFFFGVKSGEVREDGEKHTKL